MNKLLNDDDYDDAEMLSYKYLGSLNAATMNTYNVDRNSRRHLTGFQFCLIKFDWIAIVYIVFLFGQIFPITLD